MRPRRSAARFSTNAVIASRMSFDRKRDGLRFGLDHQSCLDRHGAGSGDRALRALHRERRLRRDLLRERRRGLLELGVVDQSLAQADAVGLFRVDARGGPDHLLGLARTDDPRQPLRAAEVREDPVLVLEQSRPRCPGRRCGCRTRARVADRRRARTRAPPRSSGTARSRARCTTVGPAGSRRPTGRRGCRARRCGGRRRDVPPVNTLVSIPDENARPLPITTSARMVGSSPISRPSLRISSHIATVKLLSFSGRSSRSHATSPFSRGCPSMPSR